ncbi:amino acid ABC transporter permease [uncultured Aquitalea sp.]|uniref:amino acid ABC transporter permease n=1 Tax=uncultured Aquitalea sp. TaxID=540272 RepID=UPI0025FF0ABC|nr:amino acid ABC transporter permease [uncultured Aquitalea sp.]
MPDWLKLMWESLPPLLYAGLVFTVPLTLLSFAFGLTLGFVTALARLYGPRALADGFRFYVWLIRGTPLLVQLFLIFYGLPKAGIVFDPLPAAVLGFSLNVGAYTSEVIRAALLAVPRGQWEAAYSIGLTWAQAMRRTILPQASRVAVPPLANSFISLIKDTSLAAVLTVPEIFQAAQRIASVTYEPLILYTETALIYLVFSSVLSAGQQKLEQRFGQHLSEPKEQP